MDPIARLARVPRWPPTSDLVVAGALFVWALLEAILGTGPGSTPARIAFAFAVTAPLVVRRRAPLAVVCFISLLTVGWALAATRPESGTMPFPSLLLAIFSVAVYARSTVAAVAGGLMPIAAMLVALNSDFNKDTPTVANMTILVFFCVGTWVTGWLVRRHAAQVQVAYEESGELARTAVAQERARIARELHDVVAHGISIIAVQAGAAEQLLESDPQTARGHLEKVRRSAREAMVEMRRLLGVLREDDAPYGPLPGLSRLADLIEEVGDAGTSVELREEGEARRLSDGTDLVAFRVVQESLTNIRKHAAGAAATVTIRYLSDEVEIEVVNGPGPVPASRNGDGHGLIGMRERVRIFGGDFEAGEQPDGGFRVRATLPVEEAPA